MGNMVMNNNLLNVLIIQAIGMDPTPLNRLRDEPE
jgi:hypothetical protein